MFGDFHPFFHGKDLGTIIPLKSYRKSHTFQRNSFLKTGEFELDSPPGIPMNFYFPTGKVFFSFQTPIGALRLHEDLEPTWSIYRKKYGKLLGSSFHSSWRATEKWWLGDDPFLLGFGLIILRGELLVSGRVYTPQQKIGLLQTTFQNPPPVPSHFFFVRLLPTNLAVPCTNDETTDRRPTREG